MMEEISPNTTGIVTFRIYYRTLSGSLLASNEIGAVLTLGRGDCPMSSILKVDQIQLANGNTPTAGDLGLNTTGNVLQVKQAFKTPDTGASSSFADISGMSVTITPSSASSKFLITFHAAITMYDNTIKFV